MLKFFMSVNLKRYLKKPETYLFFVLGLIVSLPILAPLFSVIGFEMGAKAIYFVYNFACHQFHTRSFHVFDNQFAWCARDTGIWIGMFSGALLYKFGYLKKISIYFLPIFIIPIALDGGIQTIATFASLGTDGNIVSEIAYVSNNLTRFLTGSFFGLGLALFLFPYIIKQREFKKFKINNNLARIGIYMICIVFLQFSIVQIWNITSTNYKPTNAFDSVPKVQEDNFFERRKNGECPTVDATELVDLECFF